MRHRTVNVLRHLRLTPDGAHAPAARLRAEAAEAHTVDAARGEAYGLPVSLYRADVPNLSPTSPTAPARGRYGGGRRAPMGEVAFPAAEFGAVGAGGG
ncbi:hypothetical protein ACFC1R_01930 [Kitasatospora sp. NPDC056138]|uniref:hypothetical protein n=1 Tax=Kitasatospora sp. NPDC056138 TaxID=3345724 RepID=UPI0035D94599